MDCSLPGSSVLGLFQARILQWLAISFSGDLLNPEMETRSPALAGGFFSTVPPGKPLFCILCMLTGDKRVNTGKKKYADADPIPQSNIDRIQADLTGKVQQKYQDTTGREDSIIPYEELGNIGGKKIKEILKTRLFTRLEQRFYL